MRERSAPVHEMHIHKLSHRLDDETVSNIVADYEAGGSTRHVAADHLISKRSVLRLLRQHGVLIRTRGAHRHEA
jgi:hypothetical protein